MANNFQFTISAVDKATATVRRINNSIAKLTAPSTKLQRSIAAFSRESGLTMMGKKFIQVGKSAQEAARQVSSVAAPLTAVVGIGSIAGIAALASEWGRFGLNVSNAADNIGMSASKLMQMRGAAAAVGVSAESMDSGLKSLGDTMEDALYGRNQQALIMLARLGIGIHKTKDGAIDSERAFMDLSGAISRIKSPQVQGLVARQFGIESLLPLMRKGPTAIRAYEEQVKKLSGVMDGPAIKSAEEFGIRMNLLHASITGVKNGIGNALIPVMEPLVERTTQWLAANRELIATRVSGFVKGFADWIQKVDFNKALDGITDFIKGIQSAVDWIGGWKNAAIGVAAVMAGPLLLSITSVGFGIGKLALMTIPLAVKGLTLLAAQFVGAEAAAAGLSATLKGLMTAGMWGLGIGAAGAVGYGIGSLINWGLDKATEGATGKKGETFGGLIYDSTHDAPKMETKLPRGIRNNNPLNLRSWAGAETVNGFAKFRSPEEGIAAATKNLQGYGKKGIDTLNEIISKWAPSSENNTTAYIKTVSKMTGFDPKAHLNMADPKVLASIETAMIQYENGKNPYSADMISRSVADASAGRGAVPTLSAMQKSAQVAQAQQAAQPAEQQKPQQIDIHVHGLPDGAKVIAKADNAFMPVRVNYSMPTGVTP